LTVTGWPFIVRTGAVVSPGLGGATKDVLPPTKTASSDVAGEAAAGEGFAGGGGDAIAGGGEGLTASGGGVELGDAGVGLFKGTADVAPGGLGLLASDVGCAGVDLGVVRPSARTNAIGGSKTPSKFAAQADHEGSIAETSVGIDN
jgi:hypothetical protein